MLFKWNATSSNGDNLRLLVSTSWQALFHFDTDRGPQDSEGREAAVRHKRRLLMLAAHPDRGPPEEWDLRHAATATINRLFAEATKTWAPPEPEATPSETVLQGELPLALRMQAAEPSSALVGKRVQIHGLSSSALNGEYGDVKSISADVERVFVQVWCAPLAYGCIQLLNCTPCFARWMVTTRTT